jgi:N-dimethylarginine dimethylaminohydrolase
MDILVCASDYFRIEYEINPWMSVQNNASTPEVLTQYRQLLDAFRKAGIRYRGMQPDASYPDMVYTANYGVVAGSQFIKANFKYPQRQGESTLAESYFKQRGYRVLALPENIYFEGEGDLLYSGSHYFVGWGKRTMKEAVPYLQEMLSKPLVDLELVDPYYYHLDTCFAPLDEHTVVINPRSFTQEGLDKIYGHFETVLTTSDQDNKVLACNMVVNGKNIVVGEGITDTLRTNLEALGYQVFQTPMSQYIKGGGSVKCCSLILDTN